MSATLKSQAHHAPHKDRHLAEKFEGAADKIVVAMIVVLGLAMVAGLLTANGSVPL